MSFELFEKFMIGLQNFCHCISIGFDDMRVQSVTMKLRWRFLVGFVLEPIMLEFIQHLLSNLVISLDTGCSWIDYFARFRKSSFDCIMVVFQEFKPSIICWKYLFIIPMVRLITLCYNSFSVTIVQTDSWIQCFGFQHLCDSIGD